MIWGTEKTDQGADGVQRSADIGPGSICLLGPPDFPNGKKVRKVSRGSKLQDGRFPNGTK